MALVSAPLLTLVDPAFVPVPLLLVNLPLSALALWRERGAVDRRGLPWALAGRLPGTVVGAWLVAATSARTLQLAHRRRRAGGDGRGVPAQHARADAARAPGRRYGLGRHGDRGVGRRPADCAGLRAGRRTGAAGDARGVLPRRHVALPGGPGRTRARSAATSSAWPSRWCPARWSASRSAARSPATSTAAACGRRCWRRPRSRPPSCWWRRWFRAVSPVPARP